MLSIFRRFLRDATGATAIEYALVAAGVSLAIAAAVNALGTEVQTKYTNVLSSLSGN